ncbi:hypothetical protein C2G38_2197504 [Gigaspora rosea]|uniref:Collagen triple helix repeat protein n=1 Tax=Gigaspora rosea TaxID=44941 RepID=A0A397V0Y0_9GLOM|nr:hypothetical protein C2G38_2197504 [Gigaspora rosea]
MQISYDLYERCLGSCKTDETGNTGETGETGDTGNTVEIGETGKIGNTGDTDDINETVSPFSLALSLASDFGGGHLAMFIGFNLLLVRYRKSNNNDSDDRLIDNPQVNQRK